MNVIYARVSTRKQSELEQIPATIQTFNLPEDTFVYREEVSAWNIDRVEKRTEFKKLLEDIRAEKINNLYIWDIDRLFRNRKKTKEFFEKCNYYNVKIYSVNQQWLNDFQKLRTKMPDNFRFIVDNMYNLLLDVYAQTAEDESNKKSERIRLKVRKDKDGVTRSASGKRWGRKGLSNTLKQKVLEKYKQGMSIRKIAETTYYYDSKKTAHRPSVGVVHKIIYAYKHSEGSHE